MLGQVSPGDVLSKLEQARATCSSGTVAEALTEVETAREWMRQLHDVGGTLYTHYSYLAIDRSIAAARTAVVEGEENADEHVRTAILQAQYALSATLDPAAD